MVRSKAHSILVRELPYSVSLSTDSSLVRRAATGHHLQDLVKWVPGVQIDERGTAALGEQVIVRGGGWRSSFGVRGIQVLLNEIPLTTPDGQSVLTMVNPAFIRTVEVSRGPASLLWGNGGKGLIHFDDRQRFAEPSSRSRISAGSFGTYKYDLEVTQRGDAGSLQLQMGYMETQGYRDHAQASFYRTSMIGRWSPTPKVHVESQFRLGGMPLAKHPGALNRQEFDADPQQARTPFLNADAGKLSTDILTSTRILVDLHPFLLTLTGYGTTRQMDNPLPFGFIELERRTGGLRSTLEWTSGHWRHMFGMDLKTQHDARRESINAAGEAGQRLLSQKEHVIGSGGFIRSRVESGEWVVDAGVRMDANRFKVSRTLVPDQGYERRFSSLSPILAASRRIGGLTVFANAVSSFETPTFSELSNVTSLSAQGSLDPERSFGLEAGLHPFGGSTWSASGVLFGVGTVDIILPVQLEEDGPILFRNEGATTQWGVEASGEMAWTGWMRSHLTIHVSGMRFTDGPFEGNRVPGVVPLEVSGRLSFLYADFGLHIDLTHRARTAADNANTVWRNPYSVFDLSLAGLRPLNLSPDYSIRPFLQLRNVLDTSYSGSLSVNAFGGRVFEPSMPRGVFGGVEIAIR